MTMSSFARSAFRAHRTSHAGSMIAILLAAALLSALGVWTEAGIRLSADPAAESSGMLLTVSTSFAGTALLVVALVVVSTLTQSLRQRSSQLTLLRTIGASPRQVRRLITLEVLLVFGVAAPVGAVVGTLAAPLLTGVIEGGGLVPPDFALVLSPLPALGTLALLSVTALVTARLATRRMTRGSVAEARRASATETSTIGRVRAISAVVVAVLGLSVAFTPLVVGGLIGTAGGASSALLLLTAVALAGPVLVSRAARRLIAVRGDRGGAATTLALLAARGYSRRLTGAVLPLALLVALGSVQLGSNAIVRQAAEEQLRAGTVADLVVSSADGLTPAELSALSDVPGVRAAGSTASLPADVRVEAEEDMAFLSALEWESTVLRTVPTDGTVDPDVRSGSLEDLGGDRTIALSSDITFATFTGVGDTVEVRRDGRTVAVEVVAIFGRGLGFGDYLVAEDFSARQSDTRTEAAFLDVADVGERDVRQRLEASGHDVLTPAQHAERTIGSAAGEDRLSTVTLLALLVFVGLAAANALVMLTSARAPEYGLLRRTGATRRQLIRTATVEATLIAALAIVIGTASVLPALLSVGLGLLGSLAVGVGLVPYGLLVLAVVGIVATTVIPATVLATRPAASVRRRSDA